jgi:hypothetical protein
MEKTNKSPNDSIKNWLCEVEEPFNPTDPFVVHDAELYKPQIASVYSTKEVSKNANDNKTKIEAILTPLINLNGIKLKEELIESFKLIYQGFAPKLILVINDPDKSTQYIGGPGLNNQVSVILTCPIDGMYKKISLAFYIKELKNLTNTKIQYECEYWHPLLTKVILGQIGEKALTTYEFCEEISKKLQLGFAATEKCKEITDPKWRQAYSERISDFITDQIQLGGLDEDSVFDCWIDVFGYLVLVNFSYIIHEKTDIKNYSIVVTGGGKNTSDEKSPPPLKVKRVFSNDESFPFETLRIVNTYNDLYTKNTQNNGVLKTCWILNGAGDQNLLEKKQIQMIEESIEGVAHSNLYESHNTEFLGAEMADDTPSLFQRHVRNMFLMKYKSRQLIVELMEVNYGVQRGTLIFIMNNESDPVKMQRIQNNRDAIATSNIAKTMQELSGDDGPTEALPKTDTQMLPSSSLTGQTSFTTNPALSGFYYVDGIEYRWKAGASRLTQVLYLIKKDNQSSLINSVNTQKISTEVVDNYE